MSDAASTNDDAPRPPEVVGLYQEAHDRGDTEAAMSAFTADARVVDEDREYRGSDEIRQWLHATASEFTYTRAFVSAETLAPDTWLVVNHIEGDFPGGVVDLRFRFVLAGELISELVIAP
jgi:ketosteroid isomerase-like protein